MPGTRNSSVGRWEHGRSGDRDSQRWLAAPISREARLIPEGIGVTREGGSLRDGVVLYRRLTAVHTVACAGAHTVAQWATAQLASPGRGLGRDPEVVAPEPYCGLRQHRRSGGAGGSRPAPSGNEFRRKRLQVGHLQLCLSRSARPEAARLYSSGHTKARRSGVRFRCSRRSTPSDCSDGHLPDGSVRGRICSPSRRSPGPEPV
jgi:hypothetical protein